MGVVGNAVGLAAVTALCRSRSQLLCLVGACTLRSFGLPICVCAVFASPDHILQEPRTYCAVLFQLELPAVGRVSAPPCSADSSVSFPASLALAWACFLLHHAIARRRHACRLFNAASKGLAAKVLAGCHDYAMCTQGAVLSSSIVRNMGSTVVTLGSSELPICVRASFAMVSSKVWLF